ncbi:hypothetical protein ACP275_07G103500 [Erythranthe tilingii]
MSCRLADNEDLVMDILLRLPVNSLLRFKTVQKSWNKIITSPIFNKLYTKSLRELNLDSDFLRELSDNSTETCSPRIAGPVNDLICIYGVLISTQGIALVDLSRAKTEIVLPRYPIFEIHLDRTLVRNVGLGFNNKANEFVVVRLMSYELIRDFQSNYRVRVDLYSVKQNSWRKFEHDLGNVVIKKEIGSCRNGSLCHWLVQVYGRLMYILSFDFNDFIFRKTPLPPRLYYPGLDVIKQERIEVFVEGNSLALFTYPTLGDDYILERWVLNGFGEKEKWTKLPPIGPLLQVSKPVALWENYGLVLKYCHDGKYLAFYDYSTREVRNIEIPQKKHDHVKLIEYKGTLFSLGIQK